MAESNLETGFLETEALEVAKIVGEREMPTV